jgi:mono/diheme cytochrome c family protein
MRFLALIGALALIVGIGAAVFFLGGFYSVAATAEDPGIMRWALIQVRTASINRHATDQPPANINDAQTVQAGARAFAAHGCANCHGAPGVPWQKYSEGLNPDPPDLKKVVDQQTPAQLFWVVKNGINMTGMPSFQLAGAKDEEIWAITAFLKKLPTVSEADYKAWTLPPAPTPAAAPPPAPAPAAPPAAQPSPPASNN